MTNQTIGMVVANMVGGSLFALFGIGASSSLILGTAAMLFVAAALTPFLCEPQQPLAAVKVEGVKFFDAIQEGLEIIRGERLLTVMTIVSMLIIPGEWFLYNTYQPVFEQNAVSQTWFGLALSLGMLGNAAVTIGLGNIEKRFSLETILSVVTALCGLGFAFLAWTHSAWLAVVSVILILSLVEVYRPVVSDYVNERIPSHRRVTVLSTISFAQRVASTVLRILLAMAVVYAGARGAIAANAVYLVIGAGISWWLLTHCGCTHRVTRHPLPVLPDVHA
jgi:MFS family permease